MGSSSGGLSFAGSLITLMGEQDAAHREYEDAKKDAREIRRQGVAAYAEKNREARGKLKEGRIAESDAIAAMAASGGVSTDAGATEQLAGIGDVSTYNAMSALFEGKLQKYESERRAALVKKRGKQRKKDYPMTFFSTMLGAGASAYGKN